MALIKEIEKPEMAHISHRLLASLVRRYHTLVERGKKMHVNIPASYADNFARWLDEAESELNTMNVSRLRTPAKVEE
jgi:hypothetical protein